MPDLNLKYVDSIVDELSQSWGNSALGIALSKNGVL